MGHLPVAALKFVVETQALFPLYRHA